MTIERLEMIGEGDKLCILGICTLTSVNNKAYASHLEWAYKLAKNNPDWKFSLWTPYRMSIANFRNYMAKIALKTDADRLFFIDDDAILTKHMDVFERLVKRDKHVIMPIVYIRGYPFRPMLFKWTDERIEGMPAGGKGMDFYDDFKKDIRKDGLVEVAALGCHCTMIKTEVLRALDEPYFLTGMYNTEDVYFCMKCHEQIENIEIFVDTTFSIAHLVDNLYVDDENIEIMREFYKKLMPLDQKHYIPMDIVRGA